MIMRALVVTILPVAVALVGCEQPTTDEQCAPLETAPWAPGSGAAFVERTAERGLEGIEGQRLSAVDLDLDGDADLIVRRTGAAPNDPTATNPAARTAWILENRDGRFVDVSAESGLFVARGSAVGRPGDVYAFGDIDNDGDLDAYAGVNTTNATVAAGETSEIFLNRVVESGALRFELVDGGDVRRDGLPDVPASAVFVDVNRDGDLDLFVPEHNYGDQLNFVGDRLYVGDGSGRFVDETEARGLVSYEWQRYDDLNNGLAHTRSWSGAACDLDDNGDLDLLVGSYGRSPNHLWKADGDGAFDNVSVASGYAYDTDLGFADNQMFACFCTENPAEDTCVDAVDPMIVCDGAFWDPSNDVQPFRLGGNNATTICGDIDNDGDLDLATTTIKHWWAGSGADPADILVNDGSATFTRPGRESIGVEVNHLGRVDWDEGIMSGTMFDFDNDGRIDLYWGGADYPGNRGMLFHNQSARGAPRFTTLGVDEFFEHNRSHGIATADFDLDGDLDVVVGHSLARCGPPNDCYETANVRYFENTIGAASGAFIALTLEGRAANRAAIGARVSVTTPDGVTQTQEVGGGYGHFGAQNDLTLHFGIGSSCEADVVVRWPDGALSEQTVRVSANTRPRIAQ